MRSRCLLISLALLAGVASHAWCAAFPKTVFLVRHAEKAKAPPRDPILTSAGTLRAKTLANVLQDSGVTAIYTSKATRTQLTAKPLADRLHVSVNPDLDTAETAQAILGGPDRIVLVVGHSDSVPAIIAALGGGTVPVIQDAWEFDNLYVVTVSGPGKADTLRLHYGEQSKPDPVAVAPGGARIMHIKFATSGGFAAIPGLAIEGNLDLSEGKTRVSHSDSGYSRELPAGEAKEVRSMIDPARFFTLPSEMRRMDESGPKGARTSIADQRQFDITVRMDDGREHTITASEMMGGELNRVSPGLGSFLEWAKREVDKIKDYKIQQR